MKRIFIVALCVALAVCALAVPASASTYEERWTNVLDYATVDGNGSNMLALKNGDSFILDLPGSTIIHDIDLVFRFNTSAVTGVTVIRDDNHSWNLTFVSLGEGLFRAFGNCEGYSFDPLRLKVSTSTVNTIHYGQLLQCHISPEHVDSLGVGATINKHASVNGPSSQSAGGNSYFSFNSTGEWFVSFSVTDWRKFDYINFAFTSSNVNIGTITAKVDVRSVTVNIDSYDGDPYGSYNKITSGYLDLVGIDHDYGNILEIFVTGTCTSTAGASFWLSWFRGIVTVDSPSIFALIWQSIKDGFKAVGNWLSNGFNSVVNAITGSFDGLKQEQSQTNNIIDDAFNDPKPVIKPDNSDIADSIIDSEEKLESDLNLGQSSDDYQLVINDSVQSLIQHAFGFIMVSEIIGAFINIGWINSLLRLSVGIGLFAFATNLIQSIASRAGSSSRGKSKGGNSSD